MSRILFVDDDPHLLEGMERALGFEYDVLTACGGAEGLATLEACVDIAVVVSDMRMPGMDGAQFLTAVRERFPSVIRILLTGQADVESAIAAVNQGQIWRFLTKPCPPERLESILADGLELARLRSVERDMLDHTVRAVVEMLAHALSLATPVAFGRAAHMAHYAGELAAALDLDEQWSLEVAAQLSHLGCIALRPETVARAHAMQPLSTEEIEEYASHPEIAFGLLSPIPRLEKAAAVIRRFQSEESQLKQLAAEAPDLGLHAQVLRAALEVDRRVTTGIPLPRAVELVRAGFGWMDSRLLAALPQLTALDVETQRVIAMHPRDLSAGMVLDEDILSVSGMLLAPAGQPVTLAGIRLLQSFASQQQLTPLIRVRLAA